MTSIASLIFLLFLLLAACSVLYHLVVSLAALAFYARPAPEADFAPPVSVLKPLHGIERDFYASLAGFFRQDYPEYEIVFGLGDDADAARWTIAQLQRDFPRVPVKVVTVSESSRTNAANPKMAKLERMVEAASHEVLVLSDADIRVEPDYLRRVVCPLAEDQVGLVTCLYRGVPARSFLSILESLGMSGDFAGQVLLSRMLRPVRFGLGATIVTRKRQIAEIGGIAKWADYLADDYVLGRQIVAAGYGVHLSHTVVETVLPHRTVPEMFRQQLRWARTIRACSPAGYLGLIFVFGVPFALLAFLLQPASPVALAALAAVLISRFLAALLSGALVCRDRFLVKCFWLLPLRDLMALGIWLWSFFGREVVWRGERYLLEPGGKIKPLFLFLL